MGKIALTLLVALMCVSAQAAVVEFVLDPSQSSASIDASSALTISLGSLPPLATASFDTQVGAGGNPGTLLDQTLSDGRRTSLTGRLAVDLTANSIEFLRHTTFFPVVSGSWLPGLPGTGAAAAPAQFAARVSRESLGLVGTIAVRDVLLSVHSINASTLSDQGGGVFFFDLPQSSLHDATADFDFGFPGTRGRSGVATTTGSPVAGLQGQLEDLGGGLLKLTLPLTVELGNRLPNGFVDGIPLGADLTVSAQVVAFYPAVPGPAPCVKRGDDLDGDNVCGDDDSCPDVANPGQTDRGGLQSTAADGSGDACQCGDGSDDGRVEILDVVIAQRAQSGLLPGIAAPGKCNTTGSADASNPDSSGVTPDCQADDVARVRAALAGLTPGIEPVCAGTAQTP